MPVFEDRFFPPVGAPEADILKYRDRQMNRWSIYRNSHMARNALSTWFYIGRHYAELDLEASFDGVRGTILRDTFSDMPRPVTNEIDPAVINEATGMVMRKWIPHVEPDSQDPKIKAAAQVSTDSLNYRLRKVSWPEKSHLHAMLFVISGTGIIYTANDESYNDLKTIGAPTAVYCTECMTKLYSSDVSGSLIDRGIGGQPVMNSETIQSVPPDEAADPDMVRLTHCPTCASAQPLQPYTPTPEEYLQGDDVFGRPMGVQVPVPSTVLEVDMVSEFFPQNCGVRQSPSEMKMWARRKIRSMEWWEEHAPHVVDEIQPDSITDLLYNDALLGDWALLGSWSPHYDSAILDHHANADELVQLPSFRHPLGRYVLCSKNKVAIDDVLLIEREVPDKAGKTKRVSVPRCNLSVARYKIRPGEIWGTGLPEIGISPSRRLNGIDGQLIEARDRSGPYIMMPADMWLPEGPAMELPGVGKVLFVDPSPGDSSNKFPMNFNGPTMPPETYQERQQTLEDLHRLMGPAAISRGNPPGGVGTTSGLQLLNENVESARFMPQEELVRSIEVSWSHMNQLQWIAHYDDEELYEIEGPDNSKKVEAYRGSILRGQYEVKIERQPYVAHSVMKREAAREAIADQIIQPSGSPMLTKRLLESYNLESDLAPEASSQISQTDRQWTDFCDNGVVPVMDLCDDAGLRYTVWTSYLQTSRAEEMARDANWEEVKRAIAGWELELQTQNLLESKSIAFYGGRIKGQAANEAYATAMVAWNKKMDLYEQHVQVFQRLQEQYGQQQQAYVQQAAAAQAAGQPAPGLAPPPELEPPPMPPPKPMPPVILPVLLQDRIFFVWMTMVKQAAEPPAPGQPQLPTTFTPAPEKEPEPGEDEGAEADDDALTEAGTPRDPMAYVKLRALVEAYHLTATGMMLVPSTLPVPPDQATMDEAGGGGTGGAEGAAGAGTGDGSGGSGGPGPGSGAGAGSAGAPGSPPPSPAPVAPTAGGGEN